MRIYNLVIMNTDARFNDTLDWLYSFVDYSLKHSSELARAEFNLERMFRLLELLGNPHSAYPVIHVAGTKGKGSVSALCAAALQAGGRKTGLYTSPHLQDYAERIQVDGQPIPHEDLNALVEEIKPAVAQVEKLTTFEITTALGFLYFARQNVDAAVIEVGLGGRLDATNVVTPRVSVITSLSYDHMAVLGDTLAKIAAEKAGIIKHNVPVISAPQKQEALAVLQTISAERHAELTLVGMDVLYQAGAATLDGQQLAVWTPGLPPVHLSIPLLGAHQVENAAIAFAALQTGQFGLTEAQIAAGFANARWPCRFEIARREPPVIFDSAHNEDSFQRLNDTLQQFFGERKVTLIMGVSEDKHLEEMIRAVAPRLGLLLATRADHPRALEAGKIIETAQRLGVACQAVEPVSAALQRALEQSGQDGSIVLSAGSMFVTAEVKTAWQQLS